MTRRWAEWAVSGKAVEALTRGTVQQTTPLTDPQRQILNALAITAPRRITTLQPA